MTSDPRNHEGRNVSSSLALGGSVYPPDASVGERDATGALLDAAMDEANPNDGDIDAWLRYRQAPHN